MKYYITKYILKSCSSNFTNITYSNKSCIPIEDYNRNIPFYRILLQYYLEYINLVDNFKITINLYSYEIKININDICDIIVNYCYCFDEYDCDYNDIFNIKNLHVFHELWLNVRGDCRYHYPNIQQKNIITNKQIMNLLNKNLYNSIF